MNESKIADLLLENLPRQLVLGLREALFVGAERAFKAAVSKNRGHRATALGFERYLQMNETTHEVFEANGCEPAKLRGNTIVEGKSGIFKIARENYSDTRWKRLFQSKRKQTLIEDNAAIESIVQPDLFAEPGIVTRASVFFVSQFSGSLDVQPDAPLSIELVVPSSDRKLWLFHEPIDVFLTRYDKVQAQKDTAFSKFKAGVIKLDGSKEGPE
ncbi:hypothetical protein FHU10_2061 [Serratia fonticola]|uniref:Uncharacterized protein n=1 Tax=Serratia fonticola TaxID=47917 RepID=A0A542CW76_SERFO|nr:hypothetical protein [Serratia fonticola]TQI77959.1 hypothetical protein FHU09_0390 [Serratia fonticola]TQI95044.1 hypothetical protein FHU11_0402 [Serratia fonticola]TVZ69542.1 hypothetical protein FHU10_2061 [Serratia fonticola]